MLRGHADGPRSSDHLANTTVEDVTVIGWNSIIEAKERERVLREMKQSLGVESNKTPSLPPEVMCFLCTDWLQQVRELFQFFASSLEDGMESSSSSSKEKEEWLEIRYRDNGRLPKGLSGTPLFLQLMRPAMQQYKSAPNKPKKSEGLKEPSNELMMTHDDEFLEVSNNRRKRNETIHSATMKALSCAGWWRRCSRIARARATECYTYGTGRGWMYV